MRTHPPRHWPVLFAASGALACVLPYHVGNNVIAGDDEADVPLCGDGVVDEAEACDDGNDDPDDGCDDACRLTPRVEWTHTQEDDAGREVLPRALAGDFAGRLVAVGGTLDAEGQSEPFVFVLDPAGEVVWRRTLAQAEGESAIFNDVAVAADGRIFAAGHEIVDHAFTSVIRCLDPDGQELWRFHEPAITALAEIQVLALGPDELYTLGTETQLDQSVRFVVRRHDPATGEVAWKYTHADEVDTQAYDLALSGEALVVVGSRASVAGQEDRSVHPYVVVLDTAGAVVSRAVDEQRTGTWSHVAPIGPAGDLLLVGYERGETSQGVVTWVRRVTADGAEVARFDDDALAEKLTSVAVSADETIFAVGYGFVPRTDRSYTYARRVAGDGTTVWTSQLRDVPGSTREQGTAVAFAPGFVIAAGTWDGPDGAKNLWVRRFADR